MATSGECVSCTGTLEPFGRRLEYTYHRCRTCGTIQLHPMPGEEELARAYGSEFARLEHFGTNPDFCRRAARTYYEAVARALHDHGESGLVVDYGAGWGGLTELLLESGFACRAVDLSTDMVASGRAHGLPIEEGDLGIFEREGVTIQNLALCTVLEHLTDPAAFLTRARKLLADDGILVSLQPTAPFAGLMGTLLRFGNLERPLPQVHQVFAPPWHVALHSLEGMRILARRTGFAVVEIRPAPQGRVPGPFKVAQIGLETINRIGWRLAGERWPLLVAHVFVLRKDPRLPQAIARDDYS